MSKNCQLYFRNLGDQNQQISQKEAIIPEQLEIIF